MFNAHHVEYLIVGGYALAFHGAPRFTGDLDIFVNPEAANAHRILTALAAFGFASVGLAPAILSAPIRSCNLVCLPCVLICSPPSRMFHGMRHGQAGSPGAMGICQWTTLAGSSSLPTNVPQAERRTWRTWKCSGKRKAKRLPCAEQSTAADALQRPLLRRSRFRARLRHSVAMTSNVKSWEQLFSRSS